jgi:diguanylate cyclase (GGDEF)-like protein
VTSIRVLQPRHEKVATSASAVLNLVGAALLAVYLVVDPEAVSPGVGVSAWGISVVMAVLGLATLMVPGAWLTRLMMFPAMSVAAILTIAGLALLFPGITAMVLSLLVFPVLFGASQMRAPVAVGITTLAVTANVVILVMTEPPATAFTHILCVTPGLILVTVLLIQAMNQQERLNAALHRQVAVDSLTGLVTRRVLDEALQHALTTARRPEGTALILIDIDAFKSINDTHGHPVGDDVLAHLAAVLTGHVRANDAVVSRLGGDELAVLLPGCSLETAARRAEQLMDAVRAAPLPLADGALLTISVSVGVAHAPEHATGRRALYAAADAALYEAKQAGRNRVAVAGTPA